MLLSGNIVQYFKNNKVPNWRYIQPLFIRNNITKLTGTEILPEELLRTIFQNSDEILDKLEYFEIIHHRLTILLMQNECQLDVCIQCGYITKKNCIDCEEYHQSDNQEWLV
jgi:hypothetical protein